MSARAAYEYSVEYALAKATEYLFHVESTAQLSMPDALRKLVEINRFVTLSERFKHSGRSSHLSF